MSQKSKPRRKAPVNHPASLDAGTSAPISSLGSEGFKPVAIDQLGLTEDEMKILAGGARFQFPQYEKSTNP